MSNLFKYSLNLKLSIKSIDNESVACNTQKVVNSIQPNNDLNEMDNKKFYRKTSLIFDKILKSKKHKLKHEQKSNMIFQPEKVLNIESELIMPELPLQSQTIQDYEYINATLNYQSYRSKIIPNYSEMTPEGLISIRLIKESDWPGVLGKLF